VKMSNLPPELNQRECEIVELAIRWVQSDYSVEEAILYQRLRHDVQLLIKERRDANANPQKRKSEK